MLCYIYIFDNVQVRAVLFYEYMFYLFGAILELFTISDIPPMLKAFGRLLYLLLLCFSCGWSAVSLTLPKIIYFHVAMYIQFLIVNVDLYRGNFSGSIMRIKWFPTRLTGLKGVKEWVKSLLRKHKIAINSRF